MAKKLAVIGAGTMGRAIIDATLSTSVIPADSIIGTSRDIKKLEDLQKLGIHTAMDIKKAADWGDVLLISVKPQVIDTVLKDISQFAGNKLVISIAAGITIPHIRSILPKDARVVRAMPNLPVLVREGATVISPAENVTDEDLVFVKSLFSGVGMVVQLEEQLMDAVTGLSGTGPMYIFVVIEALSDAGVKQGLPRKISTQLAIQTVLGAAKLMKLSGDHPGTLKDMVTSPGGTAIAALHCMESKGFRSIFIDAVESATRRSKELGQR